MVCIKLILYTLILIDFVLCELDGGLLPCFSDKDCPETNNLQWVCGTKRNSLLNEDIKFGGKEYVPSYDLLKKPRILKIDSKIAEYNAYLNKYLWATVRSSLSGELIRQCERSEASNYDTSISQKRHSNDYEEKITQNKLTRNWSLRISPINFELPSIFKTFDVATKKNLLDLPFSSGFVFSNLGEINCNPITKVGQYGETEIPTHTTSTLKNGLIVPGAFLIQFQPIVKTPRYAKNFESTDYISYVAEPYNFVVSKKKVESLSDPSLSETHEYTVKRSVIQILTSALSELASLVELYRNPEDSVLVITNYMNENALQVLYSIVNEMDSVTENRIFFSFHEKSHDIDISNAYLPFACDFLGEGIANVEIVAFMPDHNLLKAIKYMLGVQKAENITIREFKHYLKKTSLSQKYCPIRIICAE